MAHREIFRRKPFLIKLVLFIYLFLGLAGLLALLMSIAGFKIPISIYGLSATNIISFNGLIVLILYSFKGCAGYMYFFRPEHARILIIIDSILGVFICLFISFVWPFMDELETINLVIRLELLVLIPLLIYFWKYELKNPQSVFNQEILDA